uniref:PDZ domain-containing protein n=1 Tax=Lutzomyia longipalpis TaxID=7200 RepID=A0A1B0CF80_LUTLO
MKRRTQQFQKNVTPYSSMSSNRVIRRSLSGSNQGSQVSSDQVASPEIAATSATEVNVQRSSLAKSAMNLCDDLEVDAKEKVAAAQSATLPTPSNNFCTLPRRPRSGVLSFHTVSFEKGPGKKSLGFTIVGGSDSPKGKLGIFIKSILPYGQAADCGSLMAGDEILMVNGQVCHDLSHEEAVKMFKSGSQVSSDQVASPEIAATSATEVNVQRSSLAKSAMNLCDDLEVDAKEKVAAAQSATLPTPSNNFCTLPRRPRSGVLSFHTVSFEKGPGKKSLGFTIVGGSDSPKGKLGIFIKSILPYGQAADCGSLMAGDEILMVNGQVCHDLSHEEAVKMFKSVKQGAIVLNICRRNKITKDQS